MAIEKSESTGCEYSDYYFLYNSLVNGNFKYILELGSGITSIVFAVAAFELKKRGIPPPVIISRHFISTPA